jgi:hypothetical protein
MSSLRQTPCQRITKKCGENLRKRNASRKKDDSRSFTIEELLFQPWFLTKRVADKIRHLLPPDYRKRMHDYFDDYGCMRCARSDTLYRSNGMCGRCMMGIYRRLGYSATRRSKDRLPRRYGKEFMAKAQSARKLLRGFSHPETIPKRRGTQSVRIATPIAT